MKRALIIFNLLSILNLVNAVELIVPNTPISGFDNGAPFGFNTPVHYQQSYDASMFSLLGTNGGYITSVAFRGGGNTVLFYYPMVVSLSSTPLAVNALSSTFANNIGVDNTIVYSSTFPIRVFPNGNNLLQFQYVIPFSATFFYNPTNGNLLLDIQITNYVDTHAGTGPPSMKYDGGYPDYPPMCRVFAYGDRYTPAPTNGGVFTSSGLITEFGITPVNGPSFKIGEFSLMGTNCICRSTNGAPGVVYTLLTATNLAKLNWIPVASNVFDTGGSFALTNRLATNYGQQFYILQLQ
jgi:hypothetical protein